MDVKVAKSANEKLVAEIILAGLTKVINEGEYEFEDGKFKLSQDAQSYMNTVSLVAKDAYDIFSDRPIANMDDCPVYNPDGSLRAYKE